MVPRAGDKARQVFGQRDFVEQPNERRLASFRRLEVSLQHVEVRAGPFPVLTPVVGRRFGHLLRPHQLVEVGVGQRSVEVQNEDCVGVVEFCRVSGR